MNSLELSKLINVILSTLLKSQYIGHLQKPEIFWDNRWLSRVSEYRIKINIREGVTSFKINKKINKKFSDNLYFLSIWPKSQSKKIICKFERKITKNFSRKLSESGWNFFRKTAGVWCEVVTWKISTQFWFRCILKLNSEKSQNFHL